MNYLGQGSVGVLDGGFERWRQQGLSAETAPVTPEPTTFEPRIDDSILAVKEDVLAALSDDAVVLLDNRDEREWVGAGASPYDTEDQDFVPKRGRIPGARWIEWYRFMDDGPIPVFQSPEAIRSLCQSVGIGPDDDVIIYCLKGSRASNTFIALREAGFQRVRNDLGSGYEWSRTEGLPIEAVSQPCHRRAFEKAPEPRRTESSTGTWHRDGNDGAHAQKDGLFERMDEPLGPGCQNGFNSGKGSRPAAEPVRRQTRMRMGRARRNRPCQSRRRRSPSP